jgi:opacity protein-like surface antigen
MNKYLMLSAAALLAGAGAANAANKASATIYIGGAAAIQLGYSGIVYNAQYVNCTGGGIAIGMGLAANTTVLGKNVDLSDNCVPPEGDAISFDLQLPLRNGHAWTEWVEFSGTTSYPLDSGTYKLHAGPGTGGKLAAETKALIDRLKANRQ